MFGEVGNWRKWDKSSNRCYLFVNQNVLWREWGPQAQCLVMLCSLSLSASVVVCFGLFCLFVCLLSLFFLSCLSLSQKQPLKTCFSFTCIACAHVEGGGAFVSDTFFQKLGRLRWFFVCLFECFSSTYWTAVKLIRFQKDLVWFITAVSNYSLIVAISETDHKHA